MLHFWLGRSSTRCLKCAIIRNRRPERQKSMFCVTWRQVCSFFRYFARAVGLFAGRPFPNGMNSQYSIIPPFQWLWSLHKYISFFIWGCFTISGSLFNSEALFTARYSACFDKAGWIISLKIIICLENETCRMRGCMRRLFFPQKDKCWTSNLSLFWPQSRQNLSLWAHN